MNVSEYAAHQVNKSGAGSSVYVSSVKDWNESEVLSEGVSDLSGSTDLSDVNGAGQSSTLKQIYNRFIQKSGLSREPGGVANRVTNIYEKLDNSFEGKNSGQRAATVDLLNTKLEDYLQDRAMADSGVLTLTESDQSEALFEPVDTAESKNDELDSPEKKNAFYEQVRELLDVFKYFRSNPGMLLDIYG